MAKKCDHCKTYKDEEEFNWKFKSLGVRHKTCRECMKIFRKNWYEGDAHERHLKNVNERKQEARQFARDFVYNYLLTHPCKECGESDVRVLEFHHTDKSGKYMAVAAMVSGGFSVERIQAEIEKCDVLCANCHRKITVEERGWFKGRR
ncbi:MAG: hypothetical protein L0287_31640 [Anaerolineae bacterium]|nr:hypothetical protein [Anaerolineae bacterium]MCI0611119.1 hypothetical protein [Anaerolineae bacterium]